MSSNQANRTTLAERGCKNTRNQQNQHNNSLIKVLHACHDHAPSERPNNGKMHLLTHTSLSSAPQFKEGTQNTGVRRRVTCIVPVISATKGDQVFLSLVPAFVEIPAAMKIPGTNKLGSHKFAALFRSAAHQKRRP